MKLTHIRHLAVIVFAAQLAMSASAAPIDNYTDLADAVANAATGDTIKLKAGTINGNVYGASAVKTGTIATAANDAAKTPINSNFFICIPFDDA